MNTPQEFAPILAALRALPREGLAMATLTRTSGSTFRRAGARMLVYADGRLLRGLSGGCPERDIALHAREALAVGQARLLRYNRQQNFDVMLEMGCGGELEVLIEPLLRRNDIAFAEAAQRCLLQRRSGVLATVFTRDAVCLPRPRHLLVGGDAFDELQDRALAGEIRARIAQLPPRSKPQVELIDGHEVLLEPLEPPLRALLVGVNASAFALARLLSQLGWAVQLIDHQPEQPRPETLAENVPYEVMSPAQLGAVEFDERSCVLVMTHNLERDLDYLRPLAIKPLRYLGALGARARVQRLREALGEIRAAFFAPAGLDIGSETPEEIALSIAAEMLAVSNGHEGGLLSRVATPIHR
ncbi:Xanthine and CO dehydrogenase maturation factor, XdhC/CoxF family [Solimonas aquatica]|uniref:Xanthine and CO dehydrogenase maturation factor, XdhC/CoxF family n=1 Tax=Solimonas aquatica TaxID=489703 RepID=A0A1H9JAF2_9GAMM|nr:XdhC/CoxI family protein [Solimonas aquatica]SEQ83753.1 Xanthine and CO dehydrogenase maturation factor, XdhC/CoxF family [Solimonas aquatica]